MVNFVNIPKELKTNASFCLWKLEKRSGKPTKVPYNPRTGQLVKTNDEIKKEPSHLKCNGSSSYLKNVCIVCAISTCVYCNTRQ